MNKKELAKLIIKIINDKELISMTSLNKKEFGERIKSLYLNKKKERTNIIGVEENDGLEKRIFLLSKLKSINL